jgi:hypothetical protein
MPNASHTSEHYGAAFLQTPAAQISYAFPPNESIHCPHIVQTHDGCKAPARDHPRSFDILLSPKSCYNGLRHVIC